MLCLHLLCQETEPPGGSPDSAHSGGFSELPEWCSTWTLSVNKKNLAKVYIVFSLSPL